MCPNKSINVSTDKSNDSSTILPAVFIQESSTYLGKMVLLGLTARIIPHSQPSGAICTPASASALRTTFGRVIFGGCRLFPLIIISGQGRGLPNCRRNCRGDYGADEIKLPRKVPRSPVTFIQAYTVKHIQKGLTLLFPFLASVSTPLHTRLATKDYRFWRSFTIVSLDALSRLGTIKSSSSRVSRFLARPS